jgi:hypothetical protein
MDPSIKETTPAAPTTMNENQRLYRLKRLFNLRKSAKSVIVRGEKDCG